MTPSDLRRLILKLPKEGRYTAKLEKAIGLKNQYRSQKDHWLGWVGEYDGPGAYGRGNWNRDAEYIYNHIQCAPMLLWLGEALGVSELALQKAYRAAIAAGKNYARQSAALRKEIPWIVIAAAINSSDYFMSKKERRQTDAYKKQVGSRINFRTEETPEFKKDVMEYILDTFGRQIADGTFGKKYVDDVLNLRPVKKRHVPKCRWKKKKQ